MSALVLALNPSIDAEWRVDEVLWEEKNNVLSERRWPGGKGINVARWLKHLGNSPRLLLPLGGAAGRELAAGLRAEKIPAKIIRLNQATRVNVIVTSSRGGQIRFNPPGPKLSRAEWRRTLEAVERMFTGLALRRKPTPNPSKEGSRRPRAGEQFPSWEGSGVGLLILSGSLPPGLPVSAYAQLIRLARRAGVQTLLDCDGAPFAAAVKARPFLVKPNEHELAQWCGKSLRSEATIVKAATALSKATAGWVLVSRGAKRSLLINASECVLHFAVPPRVRVRNTVGAGDALLAAVANEILSGFSPKNWLLQGVKVGSAATKVPAGERPV